MSRYEVNFFDYFNRIETRLKARPLLLGGYGGAGGGVGGPPGGFIGYLPQGRVAYDTDELETSATPASGASLVDNLNHIRYRISQLESGALDVANNGVVVVSGVSLLDFSSDFVVTASGESAFVELSNTFGDLSPNKIVLTDNSSAITTFSAISWKTTSYSLGRVTPNIMIGGVGAVDGSEEYAMLNIISQRSNYWGYIANFYGYDSSPEIDWFYAKGSEPYPTATASGNYLMSQYYYGYGSYTGGEGFRMSARESIRATKAYTSDNVGATWKFDVFYSNSDYEYIEFGRDRKFYTTAPIETPKHVKSGGRKQKVATKTTNYTLTENDEVVVFTVTANASLPAATGSGQTYRICNEGNGTVTVLPNGTDTVKRSSYQEIFGGEDLIITDYSVGKWA